MARRPDLSRIGRGGLIGGIQGGVSTANLRQVLEEKGLTSANLAAALKPSSPPVTSAPSTTPAAPAKSEE